MQHIDLISEIYLFLTHILHTGSQKHFCEICEHIMYRIRNDAHEFVFVLIIHVSGHFKHCIYPKAFKELQSKCNKSDCTTPAVMCFLMSEESQTIYLDISQSIFYVCLSRDRWILVSPLMIFWKGPLVIQVRFTLCFFQQCIVLYTCIICHLPENIHYSQTLK